MPHDWNIEIHESKLVIRNTVKHTIRRKFTVNGKLITLVVDYPFNKICQYEMRDEQDNIINNPVLLKELKRLDWNGR